MKHLTLEQRYLISMLRAQGKRQKEIAQANGRHKSVVSRELSRNCDKRKGNYDYQLAHRKYCKPIQAKPKRIRFTEEVKEFVEELICKDLCPEQIVGIAQKEGKPCISHERIYQHIWEDKKKGGTLYTHLHTKGKRYGKRGNKKDNRGIIPNRVDISLRPAVEDERSKIGDFEIDTIIGKNHKGALITINERKTGFVKIKKLAWREAKIVAQAVIETLLPLKGNIHTITADNGKEFALHSEISQELLVDFYFARPYHSWERGANENLNGLIR